MASTCGSSHGKSRVSTVRAGMPVLTAREYRSTSAEAVGILAVPSARP